MTLLREATMAYWAAREQAAGASTLWLRLVEGRIRRRATRLTQPEMAELRALRWELRRRGVQVPEMTA